MSELSNTIVVQLSVDNMGNMTLRPISRRVEKLVADTNAFDHHGTVFAQEARWEDWRDTLPARAFYGRGKERDFNDGAVFRMDSWTFRHLVGGQSD